MKFSEFWQISNRIYKELSFQSIFSLRAGGTLPQKGMSSVRTVINNAQVSTLISKLLTALFIVVFGFMVFLPLTSINLLDPSRTLAIVGSLSAFLAVVLLLISFMGLQVSTAFVSSKMTEILRPLPLSKRDISRIMLLCFTRIFDIPLAAAIAVLFLGYYFINGTIVGCLISFLGILATEIFALAFTMIMARFFYSRIAGGGGKSKWKTFLRFVFMIVWVLPSLGMYLIVNFATQIVQSFVTIAGSTSSLPDALAAIYPFSYGFLASFTTSSHEIESIVAGISAVSCLAYSALAIYCLKWLTQSLKHFESGVVKASLEKLKDTVIKPQAPWLGIIRKDLRIASRSPSHASLLLLPAIQTTVLAMSFASFNAVGLTVAFGMLGGVSSIVLLLPPTLVSIEGLAASYGRSLPLRKKTLIYAKTLLCLITYLMSMTVLISVALYLGRDIGYIAAYGLTHSFSVAAAVMLELVILTQKFWKEGFAVGNLYSRMSTFILVLLPGFLVIVLPIIAGFTTYLLAPHLALTVFLAFAFSEFAAITAYVLRQK